MAAIALGLATALCWGLADFLGGLRSRSVTLAVVLVVSQLTGLVAIAIVVVAGGVEMPATEDVWPALAAGTCQLVGIAALYHALATGTMSVISPISASGAVALPVIIGVAGGESPAALQFAGMGAAFAGVALATRSADGAQPRVSRQPLALAGIAALGFGGFYVGMDAGVDSSEPLSSLLLARVAAGMLLVLALLVLRPRLTAEPATMPSLALIGLLDVGANACFALGTETGLLSVVAVLASLYPVTTVVLARALLGERLVAVQAAGVAIALTGVALIAAG